MKIDKSTTGTILKKYFIDLWNIDNLSKEYKETEKVLSEFCKNYLYDDQDRKCYESYDISANVFIYLFNRTEGYYRLFQSALDLGFGDILKELFDTTSNSFLLNASPHCEESQDIRARLKIVLEEYFKTNGKTAKSFVDAIMAITSNTSHKIKDIISFCALYMDITEGECKQIDWDSMMKKYVVFDERVKHISSDNINSLIEIIGNEEKINYGITVKKLFEIYESDMNACYIDSYEELQEFITKYTDYTIECGRILNNDTLENAIKNFIESKKIFDKARLKKMYGRSCGGPVKYISSIIDSIDISKLTCDRLLTENEKICISEKLEKYEWISRDNAKSIFSDIFNLEDKFTEMNMHILGYAYLGDVFYRAKYITFSNCLSQNEFSGDDKYIDNRKFEINMECKSFACEVENYQRKMHWIPVSKYRYINLKSDRYKHFAEIVKQYRGFVVKLCKKQFVTPYLLKNIKCNIKEIDEDDYDLSFYEGVLLSTGVHHQTLSGHRFYYQHTDTSPYQCTAPEFIRYLIYENRGVITILELQTRLNTEYGIWSDLSAIRNQVKLSSCRYAMETDTAYLDDETYMEELKNE